MPIVATQGGAEGSGGPRGAILPSPGNCGGLAPGHARHEKVKELVDEEMLDERDEVSSEVRSVRLCRALEGETGAGPGGYRWRYPPGYPPIHVRDARDAGNGKRWGWLLIGMAVHIAGCRCQ
jgi:hypothetical protein